MRHERPYKEMEDRIVFTKYSSDTVEDEFVYKNDDLVENDYTKIVPLVLSTQLASDSEDSDSEMAEQSM